MNALCQLETVTNCDDKHKLCSLLAEHDYSVAAAANAFFDAPMPDAPMPDAPVPEGQDHVEDTLVMHTIRSISAESVNATMRGMPSAPSGITDVYSAIGDGDCLFDVFRRILCLLSTLHATRTEVASMVTQMRRVLFDYMEQRWTHTDATCSYQWHELVTLTHNTSIPKEERLRYGVWPEDPNGRMVAWKRERDQMYGGQSEMAAFVSLMRHYGIHLTIRTWREEADGAFYSCEVYGRNDSRQIIADVKHTGDMDTAGAHYELLRNCRFRDGVAPVQGSASRHDRKRKIRGR